jgi:co-chaperonin GroES (HSP10)
MTNPYQNLKRVEVKEDNLEATMNLRPIHDKVIVTDLEHGEKKTKSGIIMLDDSTVAAGERGVRPRWARVYAVGPEQTDVKQDQWILLEHGRWSLGQTFTDHNGEEIRIWLADHDSILAVSEVNPEEL